MRRTAILLAAFLFMTFTSAYGLEFHGLNIPDHFAVDNQTLALNGCGLRTKFFFKIYAGALYTPVKVTQPTQLYRNDLPKVIRMQFIYHRVSASQMRGTYSDDFDDVKPGFSSTSEGQAFLNAFRFDVPEGDVVSLVFHADGALDITHNGSTVATFHSPALNRAVLEIYFGPNAIKRLKNGMLGG